MGEEKVIHYPLRRDESITLAIFWTVESRGKDDKAFAISSQQDLSTCHVLEVAIWLYPVPFFAKDFGDLSTAFIPMSVISSLNLFKIGLVNDSFSEGNWQHFHCIVK